jgi:hypothetical protein
MPIKENIQTTIVSLFIAINEFFSRNGCVTILKHTKKEKKLK